MARGEVSALDLPEFAHARLIDDFVKGYGFEPIADQPDSKKIIHRMHRGTGLPLDIGPLKTGANIWTLPINVRIEGFSARKYAPNENRNSNLQRVLKHGNSAQANSVTAWKMATVTKESLQQLGLLLDAYLGKKPSKNAGKRSVSVRPIAAVFTSKLVEKDSETAAKLEEKLKKALSGEMSFEETSEVKQRRLQNDLRSLLLQKNQCCEITGIKTTSALIASHIKPWKESSDEEKIDPENVLLLCAHFDNLFDKGLISFDDTGRILISQKLDSEERRRMKLTGEEKLKNKPSSKKQTYLKYHRRKYGFE